MKSLILAICLAVACGAVQAQKIFRVVQPDGTVEFTDVPPSNRPAEEIQVRPMNTTPAVAPARATSTQAAGAQGETGYSEFRITRPADDEGIRSNAGSVDVDLKLAPALRAGDKIHLILDGQSVGGGRSTAITLTDMDRGTHSIQAVVKNSDGKVVARSNSVTFTLQRTSINQPQRPRPQTN
ncbi:MAG: DUF4124 domain-containing protein [Gammaproteobacteria bacterium]|jgi:hypothetical protein|nr:DUF4124 domain-containing protein [Gammaproteobacteria bacterium]